ncbi:MAG: FKBP-type peptidyl-prolyl cis-trans isomerase [Pseudomonadota bacterium]
MRLSLPVAMTAATLLAACSQTSQNATPKTDDEKALYSMGVIVSERFGFNNYALTDQEFAMLKAGMDDGTRGKSKIPAEEVEKLMPKVQEFATKRIEAAATKNKDAGVTFLATAEKEKGAVKLPSGVIVTITKEGTGAQPVASDTVKVHYEGKLIDGKVFDSSIKRGEPAEFPLAGVIPCWGEGVQQLKVGAKAKLVCPSDLAYGPQGQPPTIPGNSVLVFDVELLEIMKAAPAAAGAAPPADAAHAAH